MIELKNIHKSFGEKEILCGVDLKVERGEVVCIIGPSGSGKTTLLRCINDLETPDDGEVLIDGVTVFRRKTAQGWKRLPAREIDRTRSRVGMVFQHFELFPHMNVLDNVALAPALVKKASKQQAESTAHRCLRHVGLGDRTQAWPEELSGGQRQRVAIARALAMEPLVMLFDEATSALDPELVGEVLAVMRQLADDGMTMISVTHEIGFARKVANRLVFMDGGRIVEQGDPRTLIDNPTHPRTRKFLSSILTEHGSQEVET
jgi:ABC-type polar amino acid transport system ATPase subunit